MHTHKDLMGYCVGGMSVVFTGSMGEYETKLGPRKAAPWSLLIVTWTENWFLKKQRCPGRVAQLVRASSGYTKVLVSISGQDTHKNQPVNA